MNADFDVYKEAKVNEDIANKAAEAAKEEADKAIKDKEKAEAAIRRARREAEEKKKQNVFEKKNVVKQEKEKIE